MPTTASAPCCDLSGRDASGCPAQCWQQPLIFHALLSILMWSVILCAAGAGQLLSGTPKVVICFQGCCNGQNLSSPGHAAWEGCRVHLLFLFYRNNVSCSFNFRLRTDCLSYRLALSGERLVGVMQFWHLGKSPVAWFIWRASWRLLKTSGFLKSDSLLGWELRWLIFFRKRLIVFTVWLCNGHSFSWRK